MKKNSKFRLKNLFEYFKKRYLALRHKNWKAVFSAFKNKKKEQIKKSIPYLVVISWYTCIIYLFFGFLLDDYGLKAVGFAFAAFFVYEKIRDDYIDIKHIKELEDPKEVSKK